MSDQGIEQSKQDELYYSFMDTNSQAQYKDGETASFGEGQPGHSLGRNPAMREVQSDSDLMSKDRKQVANLQVVNEARSDNQQNRPQGGDIPVGDDGRSNVSGANLSALDDLSSVSHGLPNKVLTTTQPIRASMMHANGTSASPFNDEEDDDDDDDFFDALDHYQSMTYK